MNTAVILPVGPGREENATAVLDSLFAQVTLPKLIVIVYDGPEAWDDGMANNENPVPVAVLNAPKHAPGMEQPRNLGVRLAVKIGKELDLDLTHVWFLDSDCLCTTHTLSYFTKAQADLDENCILLGPYDWMGPGQREIPDLDDLHEDYTRFLDMRDPRWDSFQAHADGRPVYEDLSSGLACFSGNLIWPIEQFEKSGGFWNELHHGRCEDGELGLRAVSMGIGIRFIPGARAFHLWHERSMEWILAANGRDVPMLNERHNWIELQGDRHGMELFVVDEDGKRFNARCNCGWEGNTIGIWAHQNECPLGFDFGVQESSQK